MNTFSFIAHESTIATGLLAVFCAGVGIAMIPSIEPLGRTSRATMTGAVLAVIAAGLFGVWAVALVLGFGLILGRILR